MTKTCVYGCDLPFLSAFGSPRAEQTHEGCYEPTTRCLFVSQMSNSVLVRIPVGADGLLVDDQDAWNVGPAHPKTGIGVGGLHNVSRSSHNPGCLWLTLQFSNELILLDAATMGVRQVIKCPQLLTREDGTLLKVGGPHCVRECGQTGTLWVALKGSVPCHPGTQGSSPRSFAAAVDTGLGDKLEEQVGALLIDAVIDLVLSEADFLKQPAERHPVRTHASMHTDAL